MVYFAITIEILIFIIFHTITIKIFILCRGKWYYIFFYIITYFESFYHD